MTHKILKTLVSVLSLSWILTVPVHAENSGSQIQMYRLYNPNSGEHFYTASTVERDHLNNIGWRYEGVGWIAPQKSDTPVYRLYNRNGGEHHYTLSTKERDALVKAGWTYEGIGWYSDDKQRVPLLREYNPNQFSCNHNYTTSSKEHDHLTQIGWKDEGKAWFAISTQLVQTGTRTVVDQQAYDETVDTGKGVIICNDCGARLYTYEEYKAHAVNVHGGDGNYHVEPLYQTVHHDAVTHQEPVYDAD